uniref:Putative orf79.1 protein n=1 Tax=Chondrus crispus TaxID=2769 RepID=Q36331_CHOCR|nr:putative orf79.1 [Chondrus crispus]
MYNGKSCLTIRLINQIGTQVSHNDPIFKCGINIVQQIKGTLGITDSSWLRVRIDVTVWYLDVDSSYPEVEANFKGLVVR